MYNDTFNLNKYAIYPSDKKNLYQVGPKERATEAKTRYKLEIFVSCIASRF